jgi:hypothetical protein
LALTTLSHGTADDVPLNPFAMWASKRSQSLGPRRSAQSPSTSLENRKQCIAALVLRVEHALLAQFGVPVRQRANRSLSI